MNKYILDFDGNLGDFIKLWRKIKKVNSIQLSKAVGKSDAYISHIENGRNKNPDYSTLYNVFLNIGIEEEKIEDYLEHFGFLSPERLAHEEALMIAKMNPTKEDIEAMEKEAEYYHQLEKKEEADKEVNNVFKKYSGDISDPQNSDELMSDILTENIKGIIYILDNMQEYDINNAADLIIGLGKVFDDVPTNNKLYKFLIKFFEAKITSLDETGMVKVINTLYIELNRIEKEKTAFGKPRQKTLIKSL
ncbi:helix-turn-helix domain-containing protein [Sutcliffiella halmapala]